MPVAPSQPHPHLHLPTSRQPYRLTARHRPRRPPAWIVATLAALPTLLADGLGAATYRVGAGTGCTHADLHSAIAAAAGNPGADTIRLLASTSHQGPFVILTDSLTLEGGYASCTATSPTGSTTLLGDASGRALYFNFSAPSALRRLSLTGGTVATSGGGLWIQGSNELTLERVGIGGNSAAALGGNVHIQAFSGLVVRFSTGNSITSGLAQHGGGLACSGPGVIELGSDTNVGANRASGNGGGLYLTDDCSLTSFATAPGIAHNLADGNGGGAYVENGAALRAEGTGPALAKIENNDADLVGGGVFVTGVGSTFTGRFAHLLDNTAGSAGGGFAADFGASVDFGRPEGFFPCPHQRCAHLEGNGAPVGGAFSADGAAEVLIDGAHLERNSGSTGHGIAYVVGGAQVELRSSVLALSSGPVPLLVDGASSLLTLANVTVTRHDSPGAGMVEIGPTAGDGLRIWSSIWDVAGPIVAPGYPSGAAPLLDCVLVGSVTQSSGLPPDSILRQVEVGDPLLVDRDAEDYHLMPGSPAIDRCDTSSGGTFDVDGQTRDFDVTDITNPGPMAFRDLGADEYQGLHAADFENGSLAGWNVQVP